MAVTRPIPYTQGVPAGATNVTLFDTGATAAQKNAPVTKDMRRVRMVIFMDQAATFIILWQAPGGAQRFVNGPATPPAGEAIAANVPFERDILLLPGRTTISVLTATVPTVFEVAIDGDLEPSVAQ